MSDPRYRPRDFTSEPAGFGRVKSIEWLNVRDPTKLRAAQIQHSYALEIRVRLKRKFGSIAAYAAAVGQSEDRVAKMLRGDAVMRLEDLALAEHHLGWTISAPPGKGY